MTHPTDQSPGLRQLAPFACAAALAFAAVALPPTPDWTLVAIAAATMAAILALMVAFPWARPPGWGGMIGPLAYFVVLVLMREAQGGTASGYAPMAMLPVFFAALYGTWPQLSAAVGGVAVLYAYPLLDIFGHHAEAAEWRRTLLWIMVSALVGSSVHALVVRFRGQSRELASRGDELEAQRDEVEAQRDELESQKTELEAQQNELEAQQQELEDTLHQLSVEKARIEQLQQFVVRLTAEDRIAEVARIALAELVDSTRADAAMLFVVHDGATELRLTASVGLDRDRLEPRLKPGAGYAGRAFVEGRVLTAALGESGIELPSLGGTIEARSELHVPIGRADHMLAVASLVRADGRGFGREETATASLLAEAAAAPLANALTLVRAREEAERHAAVVDSALDAYVAMDEAHRVVYWSPRAEALFGYPAEEALGRPFPDVAYPAGERRDAARGRIEALFEEARRGPIDRRYEVLVTRKDGSSFEAEYSAASYRIGDRWTIGYFVRDVTEERSRDAAHRAAEEVGAVLAEAPAGAAIVAPVVDAVVTATGWPGGSFWTWDPNDAVLRGAYFADRDGGRMAAVGGGREFVLDPEHRPAFDLGLQALEAGEVRWAPIEEHQVERDPIVAGLRAAGIGSVLAFPVATVEGPLGVMQFPLHEADPPREPLVEGIAGVADLIAEVMGRRAAEAEAERLKNEFFALVSHELRTPLTSIVGYLDVVREGEAGELSGEQSHFLSVIDRNAHRLQRLVGDLLFVAQIEAGTLALEPDADVDLATVASDAVEAAAPRADSQGVLLSCNADPSPVRGDRDRLGQLLDNLVSNALKFTPDGGRIEVGVKRRGDVAEISVSDTGTGIEEADLARLFDRFYRSRAATDAAVPGLGLGLSICKAIAEGHGGRIAVRSELGVGTEFTVTLPLVASTASSAAGTSEVSRG